MSIPAELQRVSVKLGSVQALDDVSLAVEPGQFLALLGPSGSGKTTALNVMAGFIRPDAGKVKLAGIDMTGTLPSRRDIGIVFQGYALFPHMTVSQNVEFPLRMRGVKRRERAKRAQEALALVGLDDHSRRSVVTLSGGQRQRVALARAIVFEPRLMLLDEPLGALDKQLREQMQLELRRLQRRVGVTTIAVTHDQTEALTMADAVALMRAGRVEQIASPRELYSRPASVFAAEFLGEANILPVGRGDLRGFGRLGHSATGQAVVRPEHLSFVPADGAVPSMMSARVRVEEVVFQGSHLRARVRLLSHEALVLTLSQPTDPARRAVQSGEDVDIALDPRAVHVIPDMPVAGEDRRVRDDELDMTANSTLREQVVT